MPPAGFSAAGIDVTGRMAVGESRDFTISAVDKGALIVFDGTAGQRITLKVRAGTLGSRSTGLVSPDGGYLITPGDILTGDQYFELTLAASGTYTVAVDGAAGRSGTFGIDLTEIPPDLSGTITVGGPAVTSTISAPGQNAAYTFSVPAGQKVSLRGTASSYPPANGECKVTIRKDGSTVAGPPFDCQGFIDQTTLSGGGEYSVFVDAQGAATGSVTLNLYDASDRETTLTPSASGSSATLTAGSPGQNARWTFAGSQGQRLALNLQTSANHRQLTVINPDGTYLLDGRSGVASGNEFMDTRDLVQSGTYTVLVDFEGAATGAATLTAYSVPPDVSGSIGLSGPALTASIPNPGQNAGYSFTVPAGQRVSLQATNSTFSPNWWECRVSIRKAGAQIGTSPPDCQGYIDQTELSAGGEYTVRVDPLQIATGTVRLNLYDANDQTAALTPTVSGSSATLTTTAPGQNMRVTFTGSPGQKVAVDLQTSVAHHNISLINPDGTYLVDGRSGVACCNETLAATTVQQSGTHTVMIDVWSTGSGTGTLTLYDATAGSPRLLRAPDPDPLRSSRDWAVAPPGSEPKRPARRSTKASRRARACRKSGGRSKLRARRCRSAARRKPIRVKRTRRAHRRAALPGVSAQTLRKLRRFRPPAGERWRPSREMRKRGRLRTSLGESPWTEVRSLRAAAGVTALAGQTLRVNGLPLVGAHVELEGGGDATTDDAGRFLLADLPPGHQVLVVEGGTIGGERFGRYEIGVDLREGETNELPYTVWMTALDPEGDMDIDSPTASPVTLTNPSIPGLEVRIPKGTAITDEYGDAVDSLNLTAIPVDRPPFELPPFVGVPIYFTVQPGGAYLSKGAQIIYPNYTHQPAGQRVSFWNYDPEDRGWYVYGKGTVTSDGNQIVPDAGVRIYEFNGAMVSQFPDGPPQWAQNGMYGDPVDPLTGLFVHEKADLYLDDVVPIALTRVYRQADANSYAFGRGYQLGYDMRLWNDCGCYAWVDLILPSGQRVHFTRTSGGPDFATSVLEPSGTPTAFDGSKITYNGTHGEWELRLRDGTVLSFGDGNSNLLSIRDRFGNSVGVQRDPANNFRVDKVLSPSGRHIAFTYTNSVVTRASDSAGREVNYGYTQGRLTSVTNATGGTTEYGWDASNRVASVRSPKAVQNGWGPTITNTYDTQGRVVTQTLADGTSTYRFGYTAADCGGGAFPCVTDPNGNVTRLAYNAEGWQTSETVASGKAEQRTTTYERQPGTGRVLSVTDHLGRKTAFRYDGQGNVDQVTRLAGTAAAVTTSLTYEPSFGQLKTVTDPLLHTWTYGYGSEGELRTITDPRSKLTTIDYASGDGLPTKVTDPLGNETELGYSDGTLASITDGEDNTTKLFADAAGRVAAVTDPVSGVPTRYGYDGQDRLTKITDPQGSVTSLGYDRNGNLDRVTDARGNLANPAYATTATYDRMDRLETRTDPLGRIERYSYDPNGNLKTFTDRRNMATGFNYDGLDRPTFAGFNRKIQGGNTTWPGGTIGYSWSTVAQGEPDKLTVNDSAAGNFTLVWDKLGRLDSETGPKGLVDYGYDAADRRASMAVTPAGGTTQTTGYGYDENDRLTTITRGPATVGFDYDDAGRRVLTTLPSSGISERYSYDQASRLGRIEYLRNLATLGELNYGYDAAGRRTSVWGSWARTGLPVAVAARSYDNANKLTSQGSKTFSYDLNGNLSGDGTSTFAWNARNELASITTKNSTPNASFVYDPFGRRQSKTVNGTTTGFLYDGANAIQESNATNTPTASLLTGFGYDETYQRSETTATRDFLTDALGSTIALADQLGGTPTSYTYDPFGGTVPSGAGSGNSLQYTGRENDGTGLYNYRARYYNPSLQRFISEDPIGLAGGDTNLYAYVRGAPTLATDPTGRLPFGLRLPSLTSLFDGVPTLGLDGLQYLAPKVMAALDLEEVAKHMFAAVDKECEVATILLTAGGALVGEAEKGLAAGLTYCAVSTINQFDELRRDIED